MNNHTPEHASKFVLEAWAKKEKLEYDHISQGSVTSHFVDSVGNVIKSVQITRAMIKALVEEVKIVDEAKVHVREGKKFRVILVDLLQKQDYRSHPLTALAFSELDDLEMAFCLAYGGDKG